METEIRTKQELQWPDGRARSEQKRARGKFNFQKENWKFSLMVAATTMYGCSGGPRRQFLSLKAQVLEGNAATDKCPGS